ncbi:NADH dehydrogenase (ubiquinone) B18 subunit [Megachile rotundata]|uniref:NADH dehydrogenase (ubiquinone) B18 subunit n=1 Tax=Megachile rotundata TaxID=143995 RepID=UPI000258D6FE|nr:PREDICTED: NADH dehydrogenase [ubiquinone] 1 beta subcomplex subunit 7 [Megachile rotundata]
MGNTVQTYFHPGPYPETDGPPQFDPMLGFPKGRKQRVMKATEEEMIAAKVPLDLRDYCAHIYLDFVGCMRLNFPFYLPCEKYQHKYADCEFEDYVLRMKEYERERRLLVRQEKKQKALQAAA